MSATASTPSIGRTAGAEKIRIQVSSDLHMERDTNYTVDLQRPKDVQYLILAGDTGSIGLQVHHPLLRTWLIKTCKQYKKVFYINGNNDCKGTSLRQGHDVLRQWEKQPEFEDKLVFLENGRHDMNVDGHAVTILGCTLWTKLSMDKETGEVVKGRWSDWKITENTAAKHHQRFLNSHKWLTDEIAKVRGEMGEKQRIVVATHHSPCAEDTTQPPGAHYRDGITYTNDILPNNCPKGLGDSDFWVFGHTHLSIRTQMGKVNVYSNQRGGMSQEINEEVERQEGRNMPHHWDRQGCIEV